MTKKDRVRKAILPHRLFAGLGMVLLAVTWAAGWFTPPDPFEGARSPRVLMSLTALVFTAWNLLACVIAIGFFHAGSVHFAKSFKAFRNGSLRLELAGLIMLYPVPIMAQVLGPTPEGRVYSLFITAMSIAAVMFGRARLRKIEFRLSDLADQERPADSLAPFESS